MRETLLLVREAGSQCSEGVLPPLGRRLERKHFTLETRTATTTSTSPPTEDTKAGGPRRGDHQEEPERIGATCVGSSFSLTVKHKVQKL
jgi:hypothetical protein